MKAVLMALLILIGVFFVATNLDTFLNATTDFRTDTLTEYNAGTTGGGVTSANITLTHALWQDDTASATISSNITADTPFASAYATATKVLTVSGLQESTSNRNLTIAYEVSALTDYNAADNFAANMPTLFMLALISLPIIALAVVFARR